MSHISQFILLTIAIAFGIVNAIEYHVYVGDDCTNYNLNANDTCIIHCNKKRLKNLVFNCGNSGQCSFNCEEQKCFEKGILYAHDCTDLNVLSSNKECLKTSTINLPNYGNGFFSMTASKSFKEMTINSGINTNNIIIDCTFGEGDECKHITINAQTAQFLQITIGSNSELKGTSTQNAIINCPQNSLYSSSSCIIDVLHSATLSFVTINTLYGIPNDLLINTGTNILLSNIYITCTNGNSDIFGNNLFNYGECWNRDMRTMLSTYSPTILPSHSPTIKPTYSPTIKPTYSPTIKPTYSPTIKPTYSPTIKPTYSPTIMPTQSLTLNQISIIPTNEATHKPTNNAIFTMDTILSTNIIETYVIESTLWSINTVNALKYDTNKGIGISNGELWTFNCIFIVCICGCCVGIYYMRKRCKKNNINKNVIHYQLKSNSSNHVVKITMSPKSNSNTQTRQSLNYSDNIISNGENVCVSLEDNIPLHDIIDGDNNETNDTDVYYSSSGDEI